MFVLWFLGFSDMLVFQPAYPVLSTLPLFAGGEGALSALTVPVSFGVLVGGDVYSPVSSLFVDSSFFLIVLPVWPLFLALFVIWFFEEHDQSIFRNAASTHSLHG